MDTHGWIWEHTLHFSGPLHTLKQFRNGKVFLLACLEEISFRMGYIGAEELKDLASDMLKNDYGKYLMAVYNEAKENNIA